VASVDGLPWWSIIIFLPLLILLVAQVWAMVDSLTIPDARWKAAGYRKGLWLVVIWFTWPIGMAYYAWRMRPVLTGARQRPGCDGGTSAPDRWHGVQHP
jgi:hypothetical protein